MQSATCVCVCVCVEAPSSAPNTNTRCAKPPNQQRQSTAPLKAIINDNRLHDCPIIQFVTSQPSGFLHTAPTYLASSFTRVADMPHRRRLRSASTEQLDVPTCSSVNCRRSCLSCCWNTDVCCGAPVYAVVMRLSVRLSQTGIV